MTELPRLTAAQAAARLGVKPESLYAYVSRGLLSRERDASGSSFDPLEVEAFALRRRRVAPRAVEPSGGGMPLMVLDTALAHIEDDELFFRERSAARLARESTFEEVVRWLWAVTEFRGPDDADLARARRTVATLGDAATPLDRLLAALTAFASTDPLRDDSSADAMTRAGARLLRGLPAALADAAGPGESIAATLWRALAGRPREGGARLVDAALVLVVDHDLAVSTLAARVAASARGSAYAIVTAALGAFDTPLHGHASRGAARMLRAVQAGEPPASAIASAVRDGGRGIPGFGQALYAGGDMRAVVLRELLATAPGGDEVVGVVDAVTAEVARHADARPNLDLALAALALWGDMDDDAGAVVFAIGRLAGWIAHAVDEYAQTPMRLRPRGRYVGPPAAG
ncbi:citrate/2-methylcitrate synthase [Microbacterium jejuense]|uniref:citrate synthase (unknown stereospecificity) n=1 Tax=Microbacterium jejuense TaxID=1263637 RepID=A0ABS7HLP5_9MICO|nr:citrate/2-methylcitrate synthase [Microbacterium jejuense]MBW9093206.1 citrate/2-methylcitrate synthase [Microbacterium jejuense]